MEPKKDISQLIPKNIYLNLQPVFKTLLQSIRKAYKSNSISTRTNWFFEVQLKCVHTRTMFLSNVIKSILINDNGECIGWGIENRWWNYFFFVFGISYFIFDLSTWTCGSCKMWIAWTIWIRIGCHVQFQNELFSRFVLLLWSCINKIRSVFVSHFDFIA